MPVGALLQRRRSTHPDRITKLEQQIGRLLYPEPVLGRPHTRAQCGDLRPCPYVGCKYNNYLDIDEENGAIKPVVGEPWDVDPRFSCSLDVADRGPSTLDVVGAVLGVTRERARQIETRALGRFRELGGEELLEALQERLGELDRSELEPFHRW